MDFELLPLNLSTFTNIVIGIVGGRVSSQIFTAYSKAPFNDSGISPSYLTMNLEPLLISLYSFKGLFIPEEVVAMVCSQVLTFCAALPRAQSAVSNMAIILVMIVIF